MFIISLCFYFLFREDADNSEKSGTGQGSAGATPATTPEEEENSIDNKAFCASLKTKDKSQTKGQRSHYNVTVVVASLTFGLTFVLGFEAGTKAFLSMEFSSSSGVVAVAALALPSPHLIF